MIDPAQTFNYRFEVQGWDPTACHWIGQGSGQSSFMNAEGLAGPNPRFELKLGWLTLFPTAGWARSFPITAFWDRPQPHEMDEKARLADLKARSDAYLEAQKEALKEAAQKVSSPKENYDAYRKENDAALARALRRHGLTRDLASYSLYVGDALSSALRTGDELNYSRDGNADFRYSVQRNSETVFSAGTVDRSDPGGHMAIWQEYDRHPNPNAETLKKQYPKFNVAEWIFSPKPYVTARIEERRFHLVDGEEAQTDSSYIFLARSNRNVPAISFEFTPRAVHSAARLDMLGKEQVIDAAQKLLKQQVILL